jgi:hypothetical protein
MADSWEIGGDDAQITVDMIEHMARYLATTGLPGFVAWIEQEYGIMANSESIQANMERLSAKIKIA